MNQHLDFHIIELSGDFVGSDDQPISVKQHHRLTLNRSALLKLMFSHDRITTGSPAAATLPSAEIVEEVDTPESDVLEAASMEAAAQIPTPVIETAETESPSPIEEEVAESVAALEFEPDPADQQVLPDEPLDGMALNVHFHLPQKSAPEAVAGEPLPTPAEPAEKAEEGHLLQATQVDEPQVDDERALENTETSEPEEPFESLCIEPAVPPEADMQKATPKAPLVVEAQPSDLSQVERTLTATAEPQSSGVPKTLTSRASMDSNTDSVLNDVQSTLDSLADMAKNLTQQKLDTVRQQENLDQRRELLTEKERTLADKDEQLRLLEARLTREAAQLERNAEDSTRALAERSAALQALAESVEARDRSNAKMADSLRQEKQRTEELAEALQRRGEQLEERDTALNRKEEELDEKLKLLVSAKDRFRTLVKSFNETVQFNNTLNAISSSVIEDETH